MKRARTIIVKAAETIEERQEQIDNLVDALMEARASLIVQSYGNQIPIDEVIMRQIDIALGSSKEKR